MRPLTGTLVQDMSSVYVRRVLTVPKGRCYLTFLRAHSSTIWAMSRLFFSIITMCPLP